MASALSALNRISIRRLPGPMRGNPVVKQWMLGHRPIKQVLDGVDVLFLYKSSAHAGANLAGCREGSISGHTFHHVN